VGSQEWGPDQIRVNTLCPSASWEGNDAAWATPGVLRAIPLGRVGHPETDVGAAVVYLAGATFVTGQTLFVDGGTGFSR
jgi:NAD(P)-dependent dehydrogenase (short-subunit alcohol dehydrogenase family)